MVGSKWIYKLKLLTNLSIEWFKEKIVAKGFTQVDGYEFNNTFILVAAYNFLKLLIILIACNGWSPQQIDVKSVYLYGILKEQIYIEIPEGYRKQGKVTHLHKNINRLKQFIQE